MLVFGKAMDVYELERAGASHVHVVLRSTQYEWDFVEVQFTVPQDQAGRFQIGAALHISIETAE